MFSYLFNDQIFSPTGDLWGVRKKFMDIIHERPLNQKLNVWNKIDEDYVYKS